MKHVKSLTRPMRADTIESFQDLAAVILGVLEALVPVIAAKLRAQLD